LILHEQLLGSPTLLLHIKNKRSAIRIVVDYLGRNVNYSYLETTFLKLLFALNFQILLYFWISRKLKSISFFIRLCEISGSHGGDYEDDSFMVYTTL
jgi:hypothetical protein